MKILCSFSPAEGMEDRTGEVLEQTDRGFFLASNTLYPPGTALALLVSVPGKRLPMRLRGEVTWARTTERAGMYVQLAGATSDTPPTERTPGGAAEPTKKPRGPALTS